MEYMYYTNKVGDSCRVYNVRTNGLFWRGYDYSVEVNNKYDLRFKSINHLSLWLEEEGYNFMGHDND